MFRTSAKLTAVLLLSCLITSVTFGQGETLRYQVEKGVTHKYKITTESSTKAQVMGQDMNTTAGNMFAISITGEDVGKSGELIFVAKVDSNLSSIDSPMMKDTAIVSKEINGKRVKVTVSALGKTLNVTALDSIARPATPQMGAMTNPTELMRRLFIELPEKAMGTGDTWKYTRPDTVFTQGLKMISKPTITYKIAGSEEKGGYACLKITFEGTTTQYGTGSRQGMELILDGTAKSKGTAYLASKQGLLVSVEQSTSQDMTISGAGEQMFTMTQATTMKSKMALVK